MIEMGGGVVQMFRFYCPGLQIVQNVPRLYCSEIALTLRLECGRTEVELQLLCDRT